MIKSPGSYGGRGSGGAGAMPILVQAIAHKIRRGPGVSQHELLHHVECRPARTPTEDAPQEPPQQNARGGEAEGGRGRVIHEGEVDADVEGDLLGDEADGLCVPQLFQHRPQAPFGRIAFLRGQKAHCQAQFFVKKMG